MYLISIVIFIIASVICAVTSNTILLAVFRAIQACGASAGQSVGECRVCFSKYGKNDIEHPKKKTFFSPLGAGVISDVFPTSQRGTAYGFFYIGPLCGPVIGRWRIRSAGHHVYYGCYLSIKTQC
jgi:MFS family permease